MSSSLRDQVLAVLATEPNRVVAVNDAGECLVHLLRTMAYEDYLRTEHWRLTRDAALTRWGGRCLLCNSTESLEVHHRSYERRGREQADDLVVLCDPCHGKFHDIVRATPEASNIEDALKELYDKYDQHLQANTINGLGTGFSDLNECTAGLHGGELLVVSSWPSLGKTAFILNVGRYLAVEERVPIALISTVESKETITHRILCAQARLDSISVRRSALKEADVEKLIEAGTSLRRASIFIVDACKDIEGVEASARLLKAEKEIKALFVDSISTLEAGRNLTYFERLSVVSRRLRNLARELAIPVVATAQLTRSQDLAQNPDRAPRITDLASPIEQEADTVLLLHRPSDRDTNPVDHIRAAIVAKHRNGPTAEITLSFIPKCGIFEDYSTAPPFEI